MSATTTPTLALASRFGQTAAVLARDVAITVVAALKAWRNRRTLARELGWLDDHMLRDIGITRGDLHAALSGRVADDPCRRLTVLALERRTAARASARERLTKAEFDTDHSTKERKRETRTWPA